MHILIVDDHPMVLSGLAATLEARGHRVTTARHTGAALSALQNETPELALLDYHLAEDTAATLLAHPATRAIPIIVIFSGMTDPEDILGVLEEGAHAFIPKSIEPDDLAPALETVATLALHGGAVWSTQQRRFITAASAFAKASTLTHKEREVFRCLRRGLLDKQIADELGLSIHTVRVHIRAIKRKRGSNRRAEQDR
jgi:DNA-binding NarL/FixJ family response regulator